MAESEAMQQGSPRLGTVSSQLIGEFPDVRAQAMRIAGLTVGVLGLPCIATAFLPHSANYAIFGVIPILVGGAAFAFGMWRKHNCMLVFTDGLVQVNSRELKNYHWRDVQQVVLGRDRWHHVVGAVQFQTSRNNCYLQLTDGSWVELKIASISGSVVKAIRQSWEAWRKPRDIQDI
jgi:hypothetical protein